MLENSTRMSSLRPTDAVLRLLSQFGSAVSVRAREQICVVKMKTNLAAISRARSSRHSCSEKPFIVCHSRTLEFSHYPLSRARKTGFGSGGRNISGLFCRLLGAVLSWRCGDKRRGWHGCTETKANIMALHFQRPWSRNDGSCGRLRSLDALNPAAS